MIMVNFVGPLLKLFFIYRIMSFILIGNFECS